MFSISSLALADNAGKHYGKGDDDQNETDDGQNETGKQDDNQTGEPEYNQTETPNENETEKEVEIMNNSLGAEIRLLQLEKAITKNILKGERAVAVLKELGYNTTALETILAEMKLLLEEVKAADPNATDAVQIFVDLKHDAINLTKEFRTTIKGLLDDVKYNELRQQIREMILEHNQNFSNLSKKIQNRIRQFNRNKIYRLYVFIEPQNQTLVEQYMSGNATLEQVRSQICTMVNEMNKEQRENMFYDLKTERIKNRNQTGYNGGGKGKGD